MKTYTMILLLLVPTLHFGPHIARIEDSAGARSAGAARALTNREEETLRSIRRIGEYDTWVMTYVGDYDFEALLQPAGQPAAAVKVNTISCSTFAARKSNGDKLFCYNQDCTNENESSLIVFADSTTGFASVSIVRGDFCNIDDYIDMPDGDYYRYRVLQAVFHPFDGMNEHGVTMSPMYVAGESVWETGKRSLHGLTVIRLVLDYARTVDEAIELVRRYNNTMANEIHYLVSDAYGDSAVIEYFDGAIVVTRATEPWQVCTNSRVCGYTHAQVSAVCWRYRNTCQTLRGYDGQIDEDIAMNMLRGISSERWSPTTRGTLWSSVYNKTKGEWRFALDTTYDDIHSFSIPMVADIAVVAADARPRELRAGEFLRLKAKMRNLSPRPSGRTEVKFYLSKTQNLTNKSVQVGSETITDFAALKSETVRLKAPLPPNLRKGEYYLVVTAQTDGAGKDPITNNEHISKKTVSVCN